LIGAGDYVRAAADDCFQRACATGKIADADVESLVLEEAKPLGEGKRQVIERGLAADRDVHLALLDLSMHLRGCGEQYPCEQFSFHEKASSLNIAPVQERLRDRAGIDVFELAAERHATRDAAHFDVARAQHLRDVMRRRLAL